MMERVSLRLGISEDAVSKGESELSELERESILELQEGGEVKVSNEKIRKMGYI
jgi:hypothetical protein